MKVIGYGDNVVDYYVNKGVYYPGGNSVNFAVFAKKAGVDSAYLGVFGNDKEAEQTKFALTDMGIDISRCVTDPDAVTERCSVNVFDGDRVFVADDERENLSGIIPMSDEVAAYLKEFDMIHTDCYARMEDEVPAIGKVGPLVVFDFSVEDEYRTDEYLAAICPHIDMALFSCEGIPVAERQALMQKAHSLGTPWVLATMGMDGQQLFDGEKYYDGSVESVTPVDTMGAGDTFFTTLLMELLRGGWSRQQRPSEETIRGAFGIAAHAAAQTCLVDGTFGYAGTIG